MYALLVGRFHAVTRTQREWLASLRELEVARIFCVLTSANHWGTRRNPLEVETRAQLLRPALEESGKPFEIVPIVDIPQTDRWVEHVLDSVRAKTGTALNAQNTQVYTANREVESLFGQAQFGTVAPTMLGLTPHELVQRIVEGREWKNEASPETVALYQRVGMVEKLRALFGQKLVNDDGELGHLRDFSSYGAQMDASLKQKLEDLLPWVVPGLIVDKGCGTGKLLVELSRIWPQSGFVGVDLSREFLRLCDENTYFSEELALIAGNIIDRQLEPGTASTVIFSSVTHEIYSYTGYSLSELDRALVNAATELKSGGRMLMRDGVSPGNAPWRMRFLNAQTRAQFEKFAVEFKHGQGAKHEWVGRDEVRLSAHLANEFVCKKDYLKNWHIEVHEEYGALTLEGWGEALKKAGLKPRLLKGYVNEWIAKNRYQGTVELFDDAGSPLPWPATNCVVVGEKG
jgi:SAM-dependent methyltransferase